MSILMAFSRQTRTREATGGSWRAVLKRTGDSFDQRLDVVAHDGAGERDPECREFRRCGAVGLPQGGLVSLHEIPPLVA